MLLSNPGISVYSQAKQSEYSFSNAIIGSHRDGSNFLLINVGRGLSPGAMSISSSSSADINPYPSFPSSAKSLQIGKECDKKSLDRSLRPAALSYSLTLETLQLMYGRLPNPTLYFLGLIAGIGLAKCIRMFCLQYFAYSMRLVDKTSLTSFFVAST
jgi:hypothetical protein